MPCVPSAQASQLLPVPVLPVIRRSCRRADPVAGRELGEQRLVETARRLRVEILDGGVLPEVGKLEPRDEPLAFALDGLAIDEEAEPLLERERSNSGLLLAAPRTLWPCRRGRGRSAGRVWDVEACVIPLLSFTRSFSSRAAACGPPGARDHPGVAQW